MINLLSHCLVLQTNVPLGRFLDFHCAGSQSPIGQIPNLPSHQDLEQVITAMQQHTITLPS